MEEGWDVRDFKKLFPALYRELSRGEGSIRIGGVRSKSEQAELEAEKSLNGFIPTAIDYLRRCSTDEEALEVIDYLERIGEVSRDYAEDLRRQLKEKGVRSFGTLKEENYYLKRALRE